MDNKNIRDLFDIADDVFVEAQLLTGDASSRQYYRIHGQKRSYIACIDKCVDKNFIYLQDIYVSNSIFVPKILNINYDSGYILQNDLGDETLLSRLSTIDNLEDEYKLYINVIDELIKINSINLSTLKGDCVNLSFDSKKLMQEISMTNEYFLKGYLGKNLSEQDLIFLNLEFNKLCSLLDRKNFVLVHRDFHSKNIMINDLHPTIIDFQDSRLGLPQYDLASLLDDCYYQINENNVLRLKKYYWEHFLVNKKHHANFDEFSYIYDLCAIQRVYKAIGSFSYIYMVKKNPLYLKYIGFAFEKLRHLLLEYPEYKELRLFLTKRYYEN